MLFKEKQTLNSKLTFLIILKFIQKQFSTNLNSLFNDKPIRLNTYVLESIIAEKYETTLERGEFNGRMRDLIDIYLIMKNNGYMIEDKILAEAIIETSKDRGTLHNLRNFDKIISNLNDSLIFKQNFNKYLYLQYPNLSLTLNEVFDVFKDINEMIKDFM